MSGKIKKTWRLLSLQARAEPQEHLYLILKISHYVEFASLLEIYTFLTYKENLIHPNDRMAKWIRFLTNEDDARWEEMANQDPIIENAVDMLRTVSMDREARMLAEAREKALKDINSIRGEGIEEGIKKGKREDAKMMLMEGLDLHLIIKITGLTESEVLELKDELKR
ncbi:Rpn family recombination-promoting nuclease/putative transposase [Caldibacillus thermoamylovorans]|uniref:Rpn family recombination-promoting nuclease/putative transposase n=1 Tax=Caldibacillus thermoamylovorans TaxID=35841 RepID=UPI0009E4DFE5|nr:Rpn family recombination-promoting nuclease/putative transposase [Caldibacillus thermoamylovorans]